MCFKILSLMFLLILITKKSHQKDIIFYSNFQVTENPEFISNFSVDWSLHENNTDEPSKFVEPITMILLKDLMLQIQVKIFHTAYGFVSFDQTFNFCNYKRVKYSNIFLKLILNQMEKNFDFAKKCPIKKGVLKMERWEFPQLHVPFYIDHTDIFLAQIIFLTKIRSEMKKCLVLSVDWQIQEID